MLFGHFKKCPFDTSRDFQWTCEEMSKGHGNKTK